MVAERVAFTDNGGFTYMQAGQGVFIAIEGSDGSGKQTQFERLTQQLVTAGYHVAVFDFPQYEQPSSFFVREYLAGKYGGADQVGPYTASLFYALDRYQVANQIRQALAEGKVVLANRFVGSSMAHQGTKFYHAEERRGYFIWLDNLEYEMLRIPRPALSFVLRVPAEVSAKLMAHREKDIHEADMAHLHKAVEVYDDMCQLFPKDFVSIDCMHNGKLQPIAAIQDLLWQQVQPLLPPLDKHQKGSLASVATPRAEANTETKKVAPKPSVRAAAIPKPQAITDHAGSYYVPATLTATAQADYRKTIDHILGRYADMLETLSAHLGNGKPTAASRAAAYEIARAVLPAAVSPLEALTEAPKHAANATAVAKLATDQLPDNYSQPVEPVQLSEVWPRNEIDIVADMLYAHSNLPLTDLRTITDTWPYGQKTAVFEAYIAEQTISDEASSAFEKVRYGWDIVSDYGVFHDVQQQGLLHHISWQQLTPRYGYEVPAAIEAAGLTDIFESCFDLSLQLHSRLQAAGFAQEAQYATLYGHRMRWKVSHSAAKAFELYQQLAFPLHPAYRQLLSEMLDKLRVIHPLIAEALDPLSN